MKRTVKTIDRYDRNGNLIERVVETADEYEVAPPAYQPQFTTPYMVPLPVSCWQLRPPQIAVFGDARTFALDGQTIVSLTQ